jgi:hypothetical protein
MTRAGRAGAQGRVQGMGIHGLIERDARSIDAVGLAELAQIHARITHETAARPPPTPLPFVWEPARIVTPAPPHILRPSCIPFSMREA